MFRKNSKEAEETELAFLSVLPDCPHVGKSMEVAFSNWWLKHNGRPINFDKDFDNDFDKDFDKSLKQRKTYLPFSPS